MPSIRIYTYESNTSAFSCPGASILGSDVQVGLYDYCSNQDSIQYGIVTKKDWTLSSYNYTLLERNNPTSTIQRTGLPHINAPRLDPGRHLHLCIVGPCYSDAIVTSMQSGREETYQAFLYFLMSTVRHSLHTLHPAASDLYMLRFACSPLSHKSCSATSDYPSP